MYEIEVRLFGIARGSDLGAAERVRKVARAARLEAYVLLAEHIHRDRETRSQWRVIDAPAGADGPLCARHGAGTSPAGRWRVAPTTLVASLPAPHGRRCAWPEAERRRIRPGWPFDLDGMWKEPVRRSPEEEGERRTVHAVLWALVPAVAVVFAAHAVPASWWFWGILAFAGFAGAARTGWWLFPDGRKTGALLVVVVSVFFTAGGLRLAGSQGWGPAMSSTPPSSWVWSRGCGFLVRQWTWGEWVGWVVPLVLTLLVSTFVAAGSVLHALFADELGLSSSDLDVPPLWQFLASLKLVSMLAYVLVVPAWWGVARHRHHSYAAPGDRTNVILHTLVFVAS